MTENSLLERAKRFISALRHCQVLGITVHHACEEGITLVLPYRSEEHTSELQSQ